MSLANDGNDDVHRADVLREAANAVRHPVQHTHLVYACNRAECENNEACTSESHMPLVSPEGTIYMTVVKNASGPIVLPPMFPGAAPSRYVLPPPPLLR
jgi:hypothetical protein